MPTKTPKDSLKISLSEYLPNTNTPIKIKVVIQ